MRYECGINVELLFYLSITVNSSSHAFRSFIHTNRIARPCAKKLHFSLIKNSDDENLIEMWNTTFVVRIALALI